jgi:uncharacterized protein (DUF488 family)
MNKTIYSIGHSTLPIEKFLNNLKRHDIKVVVDCRSLPRSRFYPQYNQKALSASLAENNIEYIWKGENLGGKLENVGYDEAINWLANFVKTSKDNIAVLCSEGDYHKCHRYLVLQPSLEKVGVPMTHITPQGTLT